MTGHRAALFLLGAAALVPAAAQDLEPRRGFGVTIERPESGEAVIGRQEIVARVRAPRPEEIAYVEFFLDGRLLFIDREAPYSVTHDFGPRARVHVIRAVAHHRDGPAASDFVITGALDINDVVNVQRVILDVSVRDRARRPVTGLVAGDFEVLEDGRPQRIVEVSTEERPILAAILIDSSGSMKDRIAAAQEAACRFIAGLRDGDRAFVIAFDEDVYLIQPVTGDRDALCAAVRSTEAVGGTALFDALDAAYRVLYREKAERRAIVVLTDGEDTESRLDRKALLTEARVSDVVVYAIGLDVPLLSGARRGLVEIAEETGGRALFIEKPDELGDAYAAIAEELRSLYQIVYASDNETLDGRFVTVEVRLPGRRGLEVRHRKGYFAVPPGPSPGGSPSGARGGRNLGGGTSVSSGGRLPAGAGRRRTCTASVPPHSSGPTSSVR
ncbi:MAG: VWA domain-containing protein [Acidobacteria bacterium]|nr:MAG: VWA domain-containing protein [Acidobacteriota bacterium]